MLGYVSYQLGNRADLPIAINGSKVKYPTAPVTLTYWRTIDSAKALTPIIEDFKRLHPNVDIKLTVVPHAEYATKLSSAVSAGNLPDIFSVPDSEAGSYKQYSSIAPETVFTASSYTKTFASQLARDLNTDKGPWALSYSMSTLGLFYNQRLLDEAGVKPPKNWNEIETVSRQLTRKNGNDISQSGLAMGTPAVSQATDIESILMMQNGAQMTDQPPTKATFDLPDKSGYLAGVKAAQFYASFATPGKANYSWSDALGGSMEAFAKEKTAMMVSYPFYANDINTLNPSLEYKTASLPQVNSKNPINMSSYWAEIVSNKSQNSEIAWDFLRFSSTREELNKFSIATSRPASRLDLAKAQEDDQLIGPFASQVRSAANWYRGNYQNTEAIFTDMNHAILKGFDATTAVRSAALRVSQEIARSQK